MSARTPLPALLEAFFTERLLTQRQVSPQTIASYRDTFRLLLTYTHREVGRQPSALTLEDLSAPFLAAFLEHLQRERQNSSRTRNLRLTAIRSFFRYCAFEHPECAALIERVLALPTQRTEGRRIDFLSPPEIQALLAAPDPAARLGRRDRALLLLAVQTGLRLSELTGLRCRDVVLAGSGGYVHCVGKGRKERTTPLTKPTATVLKSWLAERRGADTDWLFPGRHGTRLSADAVQALLAKHVAKARAHCPSLRAKRVSPHVLRHTAAMELLQAGVDHAVIALWLGHASPDTTHIYLEANMALKEQALARTRPADVKPGRFQPSDRLLAFLNSL